MSSAAPTDPSQADTLQIHPKPSKRAEELPKEDRDRIIAKMEKYGLDKHHLLNHLRSIMQTIDDELTKRNVPGYKKLIMEDWRVDSNHLRWFDRNWQFIDTYLGECNSSVGFGISPFYSKK